MANTIRRVISVMMIGGALMLASSATPVAASRSSIKVGEMAPDFTVTLIDGTKVTRDDLHGQVVILNFWATWCVPCRTELPLLDEYYAGHKGTGLRVFAVATEDSVPIYQLKKVFAALRLDPARKIKGGYEAMEGVPTNIVIGRDGRVRYAKAGAFTLDRLNELLGPLLREPAPAAAPAT